MKQVLESVTDTVTDLVTSVKETAISYWQAMAESLRNEKWTLEEANKRLEIENARLKFENTFLRAKLVDAAGRVSATAMFRHLDKNKA